MSPFIGFRRGLINWWEAGLELYCFFSLSESLISHFIRSHFLILAEVNLDNIHKYIITDGMYEVKYISFASKDSLVRILTCIFYDKAKRLFHECSNLNWKRSWVCKAWPSSVQHLMFSPFGSCWDIPCFKYKIFIYLLKSSSYRSSCSFGAPEKSPDSELCH